MICVVNQQLMCPFIWFPFLFFFIVACQCNCVTIHQKQQCYESYYEEQDCGKEGWVVVAGSTACESNDEECYEAVPHGIIKCQYYVCNGPFFAIADELYCSIQKIT